MLRHLAAGAGLALAAALLLAVVAQSSALADGNPDPGTAGPFGVVQCGQSYTPGCTVTAGSPETDGTGQARAATAVGTQAVGQGATTGGCAGTRDAMFGCVPAGCQVTNQTLGCPLGVAGAPGPGGAADPGTLAALARRNLLLPSPVIKSSPPLGQPQLIRLPTWLWISRTPWAPVEKTAAVPGESVTATAVPAVVTWQMGDGRKVTCDGPGTPYTAAYSPSSPSPDCGYTYTRPSAPQPGGVFRVTATITWDVSWTGGELAPLFTVAAADFTVTQSQAVNVANGG
jgi:hypothetical protein